MLSPLDEWLEHAKAQKHGALPQHAQILKTLIEEKIKPEDAARQLVDDTSSSRDSADTAYRVWNIVFHTAINLPSSIDAIVDLTLAIYNIDSGSQSYNALSQHLWSHCQDVYSCYQTYRTLASSTSSNALTNAQRWINFTIFSAKLVGQSENGMFVKELGAHAFFDLRNALEMTLESYAKKHLRHNSIVTAEQAMKTDIVAAAQWAIHAGDKLLHLDNEVFGDCWSKGLSAKTELWCGESGFSKARWELWAHRSEELAKEDWMSEEGRETARKAAVLM